MKRIQDYVAGDKLYHYETCGRLFQGMHEYTVVEFLDRSGWGPDHYDDALHLVFNDNDGRATDTAATQAEVDEGFGENVVEAWKKHAEWCSREGGRMMRIAMSYEKMRDEAIRRAIEDGDDDDHERD
jgi:hypothetical protein